MATKPTADGAPMLSVTEFATFAIGQGQNISRVNVDGISLIYHGDTGIPGNTKTYFGKRHLLYFEGGQAHEREEAFTDKAGRVFGKRVNEHVNYGSAQPHGVNTMILVDKIGTERMSKAFAKYFKNPGKSSRPHKKIAGGISVPVWLNRECVHSFDSTGKIVDTGVGVMVTYIKSGDTYALVHLDGLLKQSPKPQKGKQAPKAPPHGKAPRSHGNRKPFVK